MHAAAGVAIGCRRLSVVGPADPDQIRACLSSTSRDSVAGGERSQANVMSARIHIGEAGKAIQAPLYTLHSARSFGTCSVTLSRHHALSCKLCPATAATAAATADGPAGPLGRARHRLLRSRDPLLGSLEWNLLKNDCPIWRNWREPRFIPSLGGPQPSKIFNSSYRSLIA